jgi:hypothetical protein
MPTAGSLLHINRHSFSAGADPIAHAVRACACARNGGEVMTTFTDFARGNFNGDCPLITPSTDGSAGDLILFDGFGDKAIWLENGNGGLLPTSPSGINLPFTGPTWHIVGAADFDNTGHSISLLGGSNPSFASDLLWQNDNGDLAIWQSTGNNGSAGGPFPGNENQANLGNPGAGWHVAGTNDFDGNGAEDILFQNVAGNLAIWEFQSFNPDNVLAGAPQILAQLNVDQNPGATWHVVATGNINGDGDLRAGIVFQNSDTGGIAVWQNPTQVGGQIHFNIQSNLPDAGPGWHVVGMGNLTEQGFNTNTPGQDLVLQNDTGDIAIWQLIIVEPGQVVRNNAGGTDPTGFDLGNPGPGWHVVAVRDMNADGRADLLLQNDNGAAAVWDNIQQIPGTSNGTHGGFNFNPQPNPSGHLDWHVV